MEELTLFDAKAKWLRDKYDTLKSISCLNKSALNNAVKFFKKWQTEDLISLKFNDFKKRIKAVTPDSKYYSDVFAFGIEAMDMAFMHNCTYIKTDKLMPVGVVFTEDLLLAMSSVRENYVVEFVMDDEEHETFSVFAEIFYDGVTTNYTYSRVVNGVYTELVRLAFSDDAIYLVSSGNENGHTSILFKCLSYDDIIKMFSDLKTEKDKRMLVPVQATLITAVCLVAEVMRSLKKIPEKVTKIEKRYSKRDSVMISYEDQPTDYMSNDYNYVHNFMTINEFVRNEAKQRKIEQGNHHASPKPHVRNGYYRRSPNGNYMLVNGEFVFAQDGGTHTYVESYMTGKTK